MNRSVYDTLGKGYGGVRRPDPRIDALIREALGDARTVVNVGAGTGSYEPRDRDVVAVEPSETMIAQRSVGLARVVRAHAEMLPFPDRSFDAALAVLTLHHWADWQRGVAEMLRVARRVVILTFDPKIGAGFWLMKYFPQFERQDQQRFPSIDTLRATLGPCRVGKVPIPADCQDGFLGAYWSRPRAYLDPAVRRGISSFGLAENPDEIEVGLARLASDLDRGEWDRRWGTLAMQPTLDLGYRLVATT